MKSHGRIFKAYYSVEEGNLKGLHTVWFQLYDILKNTKLWNW